MQITSNNMVSVWYSASNSGIYLQHFFASATSETCTKDHALGNSGRVFWPWPSLWAFLKLGYPKNHWFAHSICLLDDNLRSRKKRTPSCAAVSSEKWEQKSLVNGSISIIYETMRIVGRTSNQIVPTCSPAIAGLVWSWFRTCIAIKYVVQVKKGKLHWKVVYVVAVCIPIDYVWTVCRICVRVYIYNYIYTYIIYNMYVYIYISMP